MADKKNELSFERLQNAMVVSEANEIMQMNKKTQHFGLTLSEKQAKELVVAKNETLKEVGRIELGKTVLDKIIYAFCDSAYISADNYLDTLMELQDAFFLFKNEAGDNLSDDELLEFMRTQYEDICFGDMDYLRGTCLTRFAYAVKSGYKYGTAEDHKNAYDELSTEVRWDKNVYLETVKELFW